jgi:serine/threonine protein kinase
LCAIEYLHEEVLVVHRDLKGENILLDCNLNLRLIDFGLSCEFTRDSPELSSVCGSAAYAAPEMIAGQRYTKVADIWSAGVLLFTMVVGALPFEDPCLPTLVQKIVQCDPEYPDFLSLPLLDLLRRILVKSPEDRLSLEQIKGHAWFSQGDYVQLFRIQWQDEQWSSCGLDREIIDEISDLGVNVKGLVQALLCREYNDITAIYFIRKRQKITQKIREVMDSISSANAYSRVFESMRKRRTSLVIGGRRTEPTQGLRPGAVVMALTQHKRPILEKTGQPKQMVSPALPIDRPSHGRRASAIQAILRPNAVIQARNTSGTDPETAY